MQQTNDEKRFIPAWAAGKNRAWANVAFSFLFFSSMKKAGRKRLFLFSEEGQGFKNAVGRCHNLSRFSSRVRLMPIRERREDLQADRAKKEERKKAIIALKYSRRYLTASASMLIRAKTAGIRIKPCAEILPYAEYKRQLSLLMLSHEGQKARSVQK